MSEAGEVNVVDPVRRRATQETPRTDTPPVAGGPSFEGRVAAAVADAGGVAGRSAGAARSFSATVQRIVEALPRLEGGPALAPSERIELIAIVGARLCLALSILLLVMGGGAYLAFSGGGNVAGGTVAAVLLTGAVGGFVSLQKRLKSLGTDDLILLANSWVYIVLSPLVGGVLAILLYVLFISGLVDGDLFPSIVADRVGGFGPGGTSAAAFQSTEVGRAAVQAAENAAFARQAATGRFSDLFGVYAASPADYAKILFWCFLAGYSERFVTNIISQFETGTGQGVGHGAGPGIGHGAGTGIGHGAGTGVGHGAGTGVGHGAGTDADNSADRVSAPDTTEERSNGGDR